MTPVQKMTLLSLLWLSLSRGTVTLTTMSLACKAPSTAGLTEEILPVMTMGSALDSSAALMRLSPVTALSVVDKLEAVKFQLVALAMPA